MKRGVHLGEESHIRKESDILRSETNIRRHMAEGVKLAGPAGRGHRYQKHSLPSEVFPRRQPNRFKRPLLEGLEHHLKIPRRNENPWEPQRAREAFNPKSQKRVNSNGTTLN
jgi:hypothetical protein